VAVNIATRRQIEDQMRYLALYDSLTQLPNRTMLHDRLNHAIATARRRQQKIGVLFVDLDGFKAINDSAGHEAGDNVLREVARRLQSLVRESDTVARYGGDEFVVVLPGVQDGASAAHVAAKLIDVVSAPIVCEGGTYRVGASVGISLMPDHGDSVSVLLELADAAMYGAKRRGKSCVEVAQILSAA
jgi:diguanylate cyclase (GGDEF)-like protein